MHILTGRGFIDVIILLPHPRLFFSNPGSLHWAFFLQLFLFVCFLILIESQIVQVAQPGLALVTLLLQLPIFAVTPSQQAPRTFSDDAGMLSLGVVRSATTTNML